MTTLAAKKTIDRYTLSIINIVLILFALIHKTLIPAPTIVDHRHLTSGHPRRSGQNDLPKRSRTTTIPQARGHSFTTFRSSFLSLPLEDRLQFLSWVFEGALPRYMPSCERTISIAPPMIETEVSDQNHPHGAARRPDESNIGRHSSRKGMPWSPKEKNLLVELRRERKLPWSEMIRLFSEQFLGRSQSSIQVYWSTYLKDTQS